jgi:FkbM family methyltransferase
MLLGRLFHTVFLLLVGIKNWPAVIQVVLGSRLKRHAVIELRETGLRFKVRSLMDLLSIRDTCLERHYERYGSILQSGWTIVDIGAGHGDFAVFAARQCPHGVVYAYEPFPGSFALLSENVRLNGIKNVRASPYAVCGRKGTTELYVVGREPLRFSTVGAQGVLTTGTLVVPCIALKDILDSLETKHCDFLKIDCEGGEYEILYAADDDSLRRVDRICLEYHDRVTGFDHKDLAGFLRTRGFDVEIYAHETCNTIGYLRALRQSDGR